MLPLRGTLWYSVPRRRAGVGAGASAGAGVACDGRGTRVRGEGGEGGEGVQS